MDEDLLEELEEVTEEIREYRARHDEDSDAYDPDPEGFDPEYLASMRKHRTFLIREMSYIESELAAYP